jgi:hypothetical protein
MKTILSSETLVLIRTDGITPQKTAFSIDMKVQLFLVSKLHLSGLCYYMIQ